MRLEVILKEAEAHGDTLTMDNHKTKECILYGMKIIYDRQTNTIKILNMTTSAEYFSEICEEEYEVFCELGWEHGVYEMALRNYSRKISVIEQKIKGEINTRKNEKRFKALKESRTRFLKKHAEITKKKNNYKQTKSENYASK